jgi:tRNA (guanine37-N1)-methyltransferase
MKIDILTLFPDTFSYFDHSIIKRAKEKNKVVINIYDLRKWSKDKHKRVDDRPFGGGAGMILQLEPIYRALKELREEGSIVILTSAQGEVWNQRSAEFYSSKCKHLILICGHYEGVDYRVSKYLVDLEISIGEYVLSGGELAAMVIVDSIVRLIPGVLGNPDSIRKESYSKEFKREYPQFTRPALFTTDEGEEWRVPEILLTGNHKKIDEWRKKNSK